MLVLHPSDELYGADRVLLVVLAAIRDCVEPIVVLPRDVEPGPLGAALARDGVRVVRIRMPVLRRRYLGPVGILQLAVGSLVGLIGLVRIGRENRVVAVHTNTGVIPIGPPVAWLLKVPHVWHLHEILDRPRLIGHVVGALTRFHTGRVVAISRAVADSLESAGGRVTDVWRNPAPDVAAATPLPWESPVVLMAGRVNGSKGHDVFVRAAAQLHRRHPEVVFRIVGGSVPGRTRPYELLQQEVLGLDPDGEWLQFGGWSDDMPAEIQRALVVVVPSTGPEALNITALEAMARGRVVIASSSGGLPEVVVHDVTGLLTQPGDSGALADAIERVLNGRGSADRLARAGRERARKEFSAAEYAERWRALYREIVHADG